MGERKWRKISFLLFGWEGKFGEKIGGPIYFSPKPTTSHLSKTERRLEISEKEL